MSPADSAFDNAPKRLMTPAINHQSSIRPADCTFSDMGAAFLNTPQPIKLPMMNMTAVKSPSRGRSPPLQPGSDVFLFISLFKVIDSWLIEKNWTPVMVHPANRQPTTCTCSRIPSQKHHYSASASRFQSVHQSLSRFRYLVFERTIEYFYSIY